MKTYPLLRHPKTGTCHLPIMRRGLDCKYCGEGFFGISTSLAQCSANLPGTPPPEGVARQWYHGSFDVVNAVIQPDRVFIPEDDEQADAEDLVLCRRCFPWRDKTMAIRLRFFENRELSREELLGLYEDAER